MHIATAAARLDVDTAVAKVADGVVVDVGGDVPIAVRHHPDRDECVAGRASGDGVVADVAFHHRPHPVVVDRVVGGDVDLGASAAQGRVVVDVVLDAGGAIGRQVDADVVAGEGVAGHFDRA